MDHAVTPPQVCASLARLGMAALPALGASSVRDRLGQSLSDAEAEALAKRVDELADLIAGAGG